MVNKTEERKYLRKKNEEINERRKDISQTGSHGTISKTPSSWWEERKSIGQPSPQDQEKRYRGEQIRYKQEREDNMVKKIEETEKINKESKDISEKERYESEKQTRIESEEKKKLWNSFGKMYKIPTLESNKETFEKLLVSAEETNKIYNLWIAELEENSRATRELLQGEPDPAKYTEAYDMWIKSYGRMLNMLNTVPLRQNMKEIFENITGTPDLYSEAFEEFSRGKASPEAYMEFYTLWMNTYQEKNKEFYNLWAKMYGNAFDNFFDNTPTLRPFKEVMEPVKNAAKLYTDMFTSISNIWVKSGV